MSYVSPQGEQSTSTEIALVSELNQLTTTPAGEAIAKNADGTFSNVPVGSVGGGATVTAADIAAHIGIDIFTSTDNQTDFVASATVVASFLLIANGVPQTPTVDYTATSTTATLNVGIPAGLPVIWIYIK